MIPGSFEDEIEVDFVPMLRTFEPLVLRLALRGDRVKAFKKLIVFSSVHSYYSGDGYFSIRYVAYALRP